MNEEIVICTHGNQGQMLKACKSMLYKTQGKCPVCGKVVCPDLVGV